MKSFKEYKESFYNLFNTDDYSYYRNPIDDFYEKFIIIAAILAIALIIIF